MAASDNFQTLLAAIDAPVAHRTIMVDHIRTSYLEAGTGPDLVLLHGAGAGAVSWYKVIAGLSQHYRVIALDKPGYGESDNPKADYSRKFYRNWLRMTTEALALKDITLVGNSQGGAIAIDYARHLPSQIKYLVPVCSAGLSNERNWVAVGRMLLYRVYPSDIWGNWLGSSVFRDPTVAHPAWMEYSKEVIRKPGGRYPFFLGKGKATAAFTDEELTSVQVPTLFIWGENEDFFPVEQVERAAQLMPNAQVAVISNAGHMPFMEEPKKFCILIKELNERFAAPEGANTVF